MINKFENYSIHTFTSPEESGLVNTQIIETKNNLIIIDAQFLLPDASKAREYIDSLNKPIERLIISHSHPDHWFGSELFKDTKIYALKEVKDEIEQLGDTIISNYQFFNQSGPLVPLMKTAPTHILEEGKLTIDGIDMIVKKVTGTEGETISMVEIPNDKILIAQDVIYSDCHIFLAQNEENRANWIKTLEELKDNNYELVLGGHGTPADNEIFAEVMQYIKDADECLKRLNNENKENSEKAKEYKKIMIEKYPKYKAVSLVDITLSYIFPDPDNK